jgi:hypothetical protein
MLAPVVKGFPGLPKALAGQAWVAKDVLQCTQDKKTALFLTGQSVFL